MADTKISALTDASALAGAEQIPGVQSGGNVKMTPAQIAVFAGSTTRRRLVRSINRTGDRRHLVKPWNPPAAHVVSTVYQNGNRVVNAGNIYTCVNVGTSGAASPPTGTGYGPITDGTVSWYYVGPTYTADTEAPTVSTSTSASALGKFYRNASGTFASGAATVVSNDSWFNLLGCTSAILSSNGFAFASSGPAQPTGAAGFEFATDSLSVSIVQNNAAGSYGPTIVVDGRYVSDGVISQAGTSGQTYFTITFPSRKMRSIAIRFVAFGSSTAARGVYVDAQAQVQRPPLRAGGLKGYMFLDSFGVSSSSYYGEGADRGIAANLFDTLGIDNYFLDALGGSGFYAGGTGSFNSTTRQAYLTAFVPDVVIATNSVNESVTTQAQLQAAFNTWYATVRAAVPNALIVVFGAFSRATTESTQDSWIRLACAAITDANLVYIPTTGDAAGPWATGSGTVSSATGTGSGDAYWSPDNLHPIARGLEYLGRRAGLAVTNYMAAL